LADPPGEQEPDEPEEPEPEDQEEPDPDQQEEPEAEDPQGPEVVRPENGVDENETNGDETNENDTNENENETNGDETNENDENDTNDNGAEDGWFTEEQAERGEQEYAQHCASCHGDDLRGNPPLAGESFHGSFETVWDLFDYTRETMPQDAPGSLDDATYADITAFVLQQNDFPAGEEELDPDDQDRMQDMPFDPDEVDGVDAEEPEEPADAEEPDADEPEPDATEPEEAEPEEPEPQAPEAGRAWLELETHPANVTINLIGPEGFTRRAMGAQTLEGLRPGLYVIAASRGHESTIATVFLESGEIGRVTIILDEMSRSADVPEEPGLPAAEMPAISRQPGEGVLIGRPMPPIPGMQPAAPAEPDDQDQDQDQAEDDTDAQQQEQQDQQDQEQDQDQPEGAATAMTVQQAEPRDQAPARDPEDQLQAERGEQAYMLHCARCHGPTLQGDVAPALAGEIFFERWQGHPVDWLYFQARAGMPPHGPAFLSEQTYADIIVYMLTESGVLEGHEGFRPFDEEFRMLTIAPRPMPDERDQLETQVERLRETLHEPHDEPMLEVTGPLAPLEWPDDPGVAPIGYPGRIDAAAAIEGPAGIQEAVADDDGEEVEEEENDREQEENDLEEAEEELEDNGPEAEEELEGENADEHDLEDAEAVEDQGDGELDDDREDLDDDLPPSLRFEDAG
jgi:mono/diheme cytochrome c family protein